MRHALPLLFALSMAGCVMQPATPTPAPPSEPTVTDLSPAATRAATTLAKQPAAEPSSPLLPSAFFADGAEEFVAWRCTPAQDLISAFPDNQLRLWSGQGHYQLERAVLAPGEQYVKEDVSFSKQGDEARVETNHGRLVCQQDIHRDTLTRTQRPDTIFFAQGNEPGWTLRLERDAPRLVLISDYGEREVEQPYRVSDVVNGRQARVSLEGAKAEVPLQVKMEARACFDDMSGKPFPVRVTVELGEQELRGCGQGIEATP